MEKMPEILLIIILTVVITAAGCSFFGKKKGD